MSFIEVSKQVERSIYWQLYQTLLSYGYIADKTTFANNVAGYEAAMATIELDKGFAIEIYGVSTAGSTGVKRTPRITILSRGFLNGDVGLSRMPRYDTDPNDNSKKVRLVDQIRTSDYGINVVMSSKTSQEGRALEALVHETLGQLRYIPNYYDNSIKFHIQRMAPSIEDILQFGIKESTYMYIVKDLKEETPQTQESGISDITEIEVKDGSDDSTIFHNT